MGAISAHTLDLIVQSGVGQDLRRVSIVLGPSGCHLIASEEEGRSGPHRLNDQPAMASGGGGGRTGVRGCVPGVFAHDLTISYRFLFYFILIPGPIEREREDHQKMDAVARSRRGKQG